MSTDSSTVAATSSGELATVAPHSEDLQFEGCEKRLLINFQGTGDLRTVATDKWSALLAHAKCTILNAATNDHFVAYLLSESSLFVYKNKIMIKTCGNTTVLQIIRPLLLCCAPLKLVPVYVNYSRTNYMFPHKQPELYRCFESEVKYLNHFFDGAETILGPLKGARWHVYVAGVLEGKPVEAGGFSPSLSTVSPPSLMSETPSLSPTPMRLFEMDTGKTFDLESSSSAAAMLPFAADAMDEEVHCASSLEIVMYDLAPESMELFFRKNLPKSLLEIEDCAQRETALVSYVTKESGIASLLEDDTIVDAFLFEPCGYSLNGLRNNDYWTIHVTPEEAGSFVSFERTSADGSMDYMATVRKVVDLLKPGRFAICVNTTDAEKLGELSAALRAFDGFTKKSSSSHEFVDSYLSLSANFEKKCCILSQIPKLELTRCNSGALSGAFLEEMAHEIGSVDLLDDYLLLSSAHESPRDFSSAVSLCSLTPSASQ